MKKPPNASSDSGGEEEPGGLRPDSEAFDLDALLSSIQSGDDPFAGLNVGSSPEELEALLDSVRSEDDLFSGLGEDTSVGDLEALLASVSADDPIFSALDEHALLNELDALLASTGSKEDAFAEVNEQQLIAELNAALDALLDDEGAPGASAADRLVVRKADLPPPDPRLTAADAAAWMSEEVERQGYLHQGVAAHHIRDYFGERFTYPNENGNLAISRDVLRAFLRLTHRTAVWEWREFRWRLRRPGDSPTRRVE